MNLGRAKKNNKPVMSKEALSVASDIKKVEPLNKKLYFL